MKLVIILVVVLGLIGGGVFGTAKLAPGLLPPMVLTMLGQEVPPEPEKPAVEPRPENTVLIDLEPLQIPLFRNDDVDRFLIIHILVEVRPGKDAEHVNNNLLRLIDTFITYIHALNALDIEPGVNDRAFLKQRLMVKAEEVLGPGIVVDLLFVNVFERPIK